MLQDRGALLKEESDMVREYKAMHEGNVPSSWLRKDREDKKGRKREAYRENETVIVKRRCVNLVSTEAFDIFSQGRIRRVVVTPGVIFVMILVVCLTVIL